MFQVSHGNILSMQLQGVNPLITMYIHHNTSLVFLLRNTFRGSFDWIHGVHFVILGNQDEVQLGET